MSYSNCSYILNANYLFWFYNFCSAAHRFYEIIGLKSKTFHFRWDKIRIHISFLLFTPHLRVILYFSNWISDVSTNSKKKIHKICAKRLFFIVSFVEVNGIFSVWNRLSKIYYPGLLPVVVDFMNEI